MKYHYRYSQCTIFGIVLFLEIFVAALILECIGALRNSEVRIFMSFAIAILTALAVSLLVTRRDRIAK
jgi:hypothetical protein